MHTRLDSPAFGFAHGDRAQIEGLIRLACVAPDPDPAYLTSAVAMFTRRARAQRQPVERVIIALKAMVDVGAQGTRDIETARRVAETVVRCCIEEYYRVADVRHPGEPTDDGAFDRPQVPS